MAVVIKSPHPFNDVSGVSVFLAGTIDDGSGVDWQELVGSELNDFEIIILNPRRSEWNSSWVQSIDNLFFKAQVEWELAALEAATYIYIYFAPGSYSPISLLELGLHAASGKIIAVCPDGFWKKGNVDIVGEKFGFPVFQDMATGLTYLKAKLV
ncbi:MAG: hypothetical protein HC926_01440 [Synechococcaceae cyanobacterium SM2_3_60]|nr:hypothetical protein [Synechococcaceae cyanobacterium SM2_3_60]